MILRNDYNLIPALEELQNRADWKKRKFLRGISLKTLKYFLKENALFYDTGE